jgi:hypothetical protein
MCRAPWKPFGTETGQNRWTQRSPGSAVALWNHDGLYETVWAYALWTNLPRLEELVPRRDGDSPRAGSTENDGHGIERYGIDSGRCGGFPTIAETWRNSCGGTPCLNFVAILSLVVGSLFQRKGAAARGVGFAQRKSGVCPLPFLSGNEAKTPPEISAHGPRGARSQHAGLDHPGGPNKFPALQIEGDLHRSGEDLFDRMDGLGAHEVIVETDDHTRQAGKP